MIPNFMKLLSVRNVIGLQRLQKVPVRAVGAAVKRLEAAMSKNTQMNLHNLNELKHQLVRRNFTNAITRIRFAEHLDKESDPLGRLHFLINRLDIVIKEMPEYKRLVLHCSRLLNDYQ